MAKLVSIGEDYDNVSGVRSRGYTIRRVKTSIIVIYVFVTPSLRSHGIGGQLLTEMRSYLADEATRWKRGRVLGLFTELERAECSDLDSTRRLRFWERGGVVPLDFEWRYPRLHEGQLPVRMYLAFGSYEETRKAWYPQELEGVARELFRATYSYLPSASATLEAIVQDLRSHPHDRLVSYVSSQ